MARGAFWRVLTAVAVLAGEAVLATTFVVSAPTSSDAQWFWGGDQGARRRSGFDWFQQQPQAPSQSERPAPPPDYSRAPPPKKLDPKAEAAVTTPILVLGDSMADWLGYGLEQAYSDSPEIGILRRYKTYSGLIRIKRKHDPRDEFPDWPQEAREVIASTKPKFVLMMIGINDRRQFRHVVQGQVTKGQVTKGQVTKGQVTKGQVTKGQVTEKVTQASPKPAAQPPAPAQAAPQVQSAAATDGDKLAGDDKQAAPPPPPPPAAPAPKPKPSAPVVTNLEFRSDAWGEAYSRRIDETIAALKTSGVPVFWVGLPPLRGQRAAVDIPYLNDLYRSRADKAGIIYIDVWDGFVDDQGRYSQYGPDVEGQTRRLRTGDGVYFTQAGARKLAHFVQREIERWLNNRPPVVAIAVPDEPKDSKAASAAAGKPGPHERPLSGPVVPLTAERAMESSDLLGGGKRPATTDAIAKKVLVEGDALPAPAGRADDFAWPRRGVAPVGTDPVVVTTDLPMTPMVAERPAPVNVATASPAGQPAGASTPRQGVPKLVVHRPRYYADQQQGIYRPDYRRPQPVQPQPWSLNSLFGGGGQSWYRW